MKKILPVILFVFIFTSSFLYLHQKIQIYVEAYQLSSNYHCYNELVDKRDYLMYNLAKEVSIAKVNQWAQTQDFILVDKERVLALNMEEQKKIKSNKIASLINRFLRTSVSASTALAKEKK